MMGGLSIAFALPIGPLLAMTIADKVQRKWLTVVPAWGIVVLGLAFGQMRDAVVLTLLAGAPAWQSPRVDPHSQGRHERRTPHGQQRSTFREDIEWTVQRAAAGPSTWPASPSSALPASGWASR